MRKNLILIAVPSIILISVVASFLYYYFLLKEEQFKVIKEEVYRDIKNISLDGISPLEVRYITILYDKVYMISLSVYQFRNENDAKVFEKLFIQLKKSFIKDEKDLNIDGNEIKILLIEFEGKNSYGTIFTKENKLVIGSYYNETVLLNVIKWILKRI
jgi:hypothetical protein